MIAMSEKPVLDGSLTILVRAASDSIAGGGNDSKNVVHLAKTFFPASS